MKSADVLSKIPKVASMSPSTQNIQRNTASDAYHMQCWLRNYVEGFQTTNEAAIHVSREYGEHQMECRELVTHPRLLDALADSTPPLLPTRPTLHVQPNDLETSEVRVASEQAFSSGANALLQSLQDAEQAGFTFDDEYVAMINRYARG